ncbi:hypothetical protein SAMN05216223_1118 [Actinacidiphila yanglinensis]|uniref:Uncharacterized protein n=1 Tax=Actinacidiphila yanglinensis TaxID=310779 RepID=A0A1H6D028_9ACTN|nr:hypothetical protein SAMN05216223_1118 [Actinacidiphila yanglinensis]
MATLSHCPARRGHGHQQQRAGLRPKGRYLWSGSASQGGAGHLRAAVSPPWAGAGPMAGSGCRWGPSGWVPAEADRVRGGRTGCGAEGNGRPDDRSRQCRTQRPGEAEGTSLLVCEDDGTHFVPVQPRRVDRWQARGLGRRTHAPRCGRSAQQPQTPLAQLRPQAPAARAVHRKNQPGDLPPPVPHDSTLRASPSAPPVTRSCLWTSRSPQVSLGRRDCCPSGRSASSSRRWAVRRRCRCTTRAAAWSGSPRRPRKRPR